MKPKFFSKIAWLVMFALTPFVNYAQQEHSASSNTHFSNALFNALVVIIILLLVLIAVIGSVIKNVVASDYFKNNLKKDSATNNSSTTGKTIGMIALFLLLNLAANAQDKAAIIVKDDWLIGGLDMFTFYIMTAIILFEVSLLAILLNILKRLLKSATVETEEPSASTVKKPQEKTILDKLNASVEIDKEEEIMLDHNYDGIRELDNNLPPWWKYGFALTVVVAIIYLTHYHISKTGDLQTAEYNKEMTKAKIEVEEYLKTSANNVDENTVKLLDKAEDIEAGKQTFIANCVACHGKLANGKLGEIDGAGPNLTDNYWLHGGGIAEIFKSIKYGWTDKGMKSWKEDLSPIQIAQVASYIKSLKGSAATGKAPQGDLYQDAGSPAIKDSLSAPTDSLKLKAIADSLDIAAKKEIK